MNDRSYLRNAGIPEDFRGLGLFEADLQGQADRNKLRRPPAIRRLAARFQLCLALTHLICELQGCLHSN